MTRDPPRTKPIDTLFPDTTLVRSPGSNLRRPPHVSGNLSEAEDFPLCDLSREELKFAVRGEVDRARLERVSDPSYEPDGTVQGLDSRADRKSTRLNSSH